MLENRSFDHMFGFLKSPECAIDGLDGDETNPDENGIQVFVSSDARYSGDFTPDPGHHFPNVNVQIFGNEEGTGAAAMQGFVTSYRAMGGSSLTQSQKIMRCYAPSKIPILTTLARQYAICDRWFSSVPGPTLPNRAYAHAATSIGRVDMDPIWFNISKTIYELLAESGVTSKIYFHDATVAMTFKNLLGNQKVFGSFDDFLDACGDGKLPAYSFVEPRYNADDKKNLAANDQHPDHDVAEGEMLIRDVYDAVRNSKKWPNTVLLVTYDEHGGLYDHVTPPAAPNPDGKVSTNPPFDFTRLGVRVPSVVVSPWISAGTIDHTQYEHSSIATTARKLFLGPAWQTQFLTERDRLANPFDGVLTLSAPRTDKVKFEAPRNSAALARSTNLALIAERTAKHAALPLSELQQTLLAQSSFANQTLHPGDKSSIPLHEIQTEAQAAAFHQEVAPRIVEPKAQSGGGV